jgi:hypothetical protein
VQFTDRVAVSHDIYRVPNNSRSSNPRNERHWNGLGAHALARDAARGVEALKRADCRLGGCSLRHGFSEEHAASRTARPQPLASGRRIRRVFAGSFSQHAAPPSAPPAPGAALPQEAWRAVEVPADVLSKILTPPSANVRTTTEGIGGKFHEAEAEATRQALGDEVPPSNRRRASCALPRSGFGAARIKRATDAHWRDSMTAGIAAKAALAVVGGALLRRAASGKLTRGQPKPASDALGPGGLVTLTRPSVF